MCIHEDKKQINAVNQLIDVLNNGDAVSKRIASVSTVKSWKNEPPATPYQNYKRILKQVERNRKDIKKVFQSWNKKFKQRYSDYRGSLFRLKKEDITAEAWEQILSFGLINSQELYNVLIRMADDELKVSAKEVEANIFKLKAVVIESDNQIPQNVLSFFQQYELRLSESTAAVVDNSLKNIVMNGLANGESTATIANNISSSFINLGNKKSALIARTETIRASAEGAKIAYARGGIKKLAVLPALTACPVCMEKASNNPYTADNLKFQIPIHPNCRCCWIPVFSDTDVEAINTGIVNANSF